MKDNQNQPLQGAEEQEALTRILKGTASETGERFFASLVENLSKALHAQLAWVTEYVDAEDSLRVLAFFSPGSANLVDKYPLVGTPCEPVVHGATLVHVPDAVAERFPDDVAIQAMAIRSYLGVPLLDLSGNVLGHLAVMDTEPMPAEPRFLTVLQIFASRAAAELQRLNAEAAAREHAQQVSQLIDSAMDAIVQIDAGLNVLMLNPAAEQLLQTDAPQATGRGFDEFLQAASTRKMRGLIDEVDQRSEGDRSLWVPGGLMIEGSARVTAEATLSRFPTQSGDRYTLILRNVNDRLEAERQIQSLTVQAGYLKEEIQSLTGFDEIVGRSAALQRVFSDVEDVAATDTTVLVTGETGTGKELVVRAIHNASQRADKPLIKVNCGALPENLIESELFGHEKGAFTGATQRREGRFTLADGGTLFLDEIGDLPLQLQVRLLRVLQEGEFERLGSSVTRTVDVRVIAATNRDLFASVDSGEFREDLYYRLAVFPLRLPPLRERLDDIEPLALALIHRYSKKLGRTPVNLDSGDLERLCAYTWPGNVRELQNVVERGLITAVDGRLNLDRALPETLDMPKAEIIRKASDMERLERENIIAALERTSWQVAGKNGAAELLGMNPSTLSSRLNALGIKRPRRRPQE